MRRASLLLGAVCFGTVLLAVAAASAQQDEKDIRIQSNVLCFNDPALDSVALIEFPFTLNRHDFEFAPVQDDQGNTTWQANIQAQIKLFSTSGFPVDSTSTRFGAMAKSQEESRREGIKLFNTLRMVVKPGNYTAHMEVYDLNSGKVGQSFFDKVLVEPLDKRNLTIAGAGFAYHIGHVSDPEAARRDPNVRNGYRVLSNPLGLFKSTDTVAFFYAEIYNLSEGAAPKALDMSYRILGPASSVVQDFGHKIMDRPGPSVVIAEPFDLGSIGHGLYSFEVIALDLTAGKADTLAIPLRVIDPSVAATYASASEDDNASVDVSFDAELNMVYHLLEPNQLQQLNSLNLNGKRAFLDRFWRVQALNAGMTLDDYKSEIRDRFDYVNERFSSIHSDTDGWQSDRGRIYLQYGPPEEIVDIQTPIDGEPFTIWYYHSIREGTVFVFSDEDSDFEYKLVHSNANKEYYDYDWDLKLQREIYKIY